MKLITQEQIQIILQDIYLTNIPVSRFDAIKKLLLELPTQEENVKPKTDSK